MSLIRTAVNNFPGGEDVLCPEDCFAADEQRPCPVIEEINSRVSRKDSVVANIVHDIRIPLTSIKGYINLIVKTPEDANNRERLGVVHRQTMRLEALIRDLSNTVEQRNEMNYRFVELEVDTILTRALATFTVPSLKHKLVLEKVGDISSIRADENRILQVMDNIISNAIKYSPSESEIIIMATQKGDVVCFSVRDQGLGISEEELPRVFDRYYQIKTSESGQISGLGLGLAIAREIIEAHEGKIWAESLGKSYGSRFNFTVPVYKA